ncbi:MAG: aspartate 1-decarboxylase [Thermoanaerobaculia bacterium]|nr:aspartate 1-decarboxylase [Thermoanaerobaculia bacterium]
MTRFFLRCKIHRATVTEANVDYEGSITIDRDLLDVAGLQPYEKVEIYNVTRGTRFETYAIEGEAGAGEICVNGAAAHLVEVGDLVIIACYCALEPKEVAGHRPTLVFVDRRNRIRTIKHAETAKTVTV